MPASVNSPSAERRACVATIAGVQLGMGICNTRCLPRRTVRSLCELHRGTAAKSQRERQKSTKVLWTSLDRVCPSCLVEREGERERQRCDGAKFGSPSKGPKLFSLPSPAEADVIWSTAARPSLHPTIQSFPTEPPGRMPAQGQRCGAVFWLCGGRRRCDGPAATISFQLQIPSLFSSLHSRMRCAWGGKPPP